MKTVTAELMYPNALGRVWATDNALRTALVADPALTFSVIGGLNWTVSYKDVEGYPRTLCTGPMKTVLWGAEQFRKLTGKEVAL